VSSVACNVIARRSPCAQLWCARHSTVPFTAFPFMADTASPIFLPSFTVLHGNDGYVGISLGSGINGHDLQVDTGIQPLGPAKGEG
jgi:hypothetical protein